MAEVVKTGLLAGEPLWELPDAELVRRCAAFKAGALPARSARPGRPRHGSIWATRSHTRSRPRPALRAAARPRGRARAARRAAALRPRHRRRRARCSRPSPVRVDRERAWAGAAARQERVAACRGSSCSATPGRPRLASSSRPPRSRGARRADRRVESAPCASPSSTASTSTCSAAATPSCTAGSRSPSSRRSIYAVGEGARLQRPVPADEQRGRVRRLVPRRARLGRRRDRSIPARGRTTATRSATRVELFNVPIVEVHLSNIDEREEWRRTSVIADLAAKRVIRQRARGLPGRRSNVPGAARVNERESNGCAALLDEPLLVTSRRQRPLPDRASRARTPRCSSTRTATRRSSRTSATPRRRGRSRGVRFETERRGP